MEAAEVAALEPQQPFRSGRQPRMILVTGATGFVGAHVTRMLCSRGENVRVLVRANSSRRAIEDLRVECIVGDLRDRPSLEPAFRGVRQVYHVAADYRLWAIYP